MRRAVSLNGRWRVTEYDVANVHVDESDWDDREAWYVAWTAESWDEALAWIMERGV